MATEIDQRSATADTDLGLSSLEASRVSSTQPSTQILAVNEEVGYVRSRARQLSDQTQDMHRRTQLHAWAARTTERGREAPVDLLAHLSELGFSWRDVARMLQVSVPSLQKWRRGQKITGDNRLKLASLVAVCDQVTQDYLISEVASWFEMPVWPGVPVTPIDLMVATKPDLLFEYAAGHRDAETVLTELDPDWRERYRSDFEAFTADDGQASIRRKA